jgi:GT2 family glycosyltransferase
MISRVIQSALHLFEDINSFEANLRSVNVMLVCDGYRVIPREPLTHDWSESKTGRVTAEAAAKYAEYCHRLETYAKEMNSSSFYGDINFTVIKLASHHGFAGAVNASLYRVSTPYALILQQDRVFSENVKDVPLLNIMQLMNSTKSIRYIGILFEYIHFYLSSNEIHVPFRLPNVQEHSALSHAA